MPPLYPKHYRLNSSGILAPGVRARVVKPDGSLAGYDEEGELQIRTPAIAMGYLDDEAACVVFTIPLPKATFELDPLEHEKLSSMARENRVSTYSDEKLKDTIVADG